jgi:ATPase family associated with various cellular activities (AAA)
MSDRVVASMSALCQAITRVECAVKLAGNHRPMILAPTFLAIPEQRAMDGSGKSANAPDHVVTGVTHEHFDIASFVMDTRLANTWARRRAEYVIHRELRFSARMELHAVFDDLAINLGWQAHRTDATSLLFDADGLFISGLGARKPDYCSCKFDIWAKSPQHAETAGMAILARIGDALLRDPMIRIDWAFVSGKGELHITHMEEIADDILYDEAYPDLEGGIASFIGDYLVSSETVLVLQGPPGTGKTRLIRGALGEIARRKGGIARALFTGDKKALESDEIFVNFLTGACDAFVVEDADHLLQPRAKGNDHLHRFLAIADGIVRAQGRKIIFSTNLPNVGDLDDALVRPGRCFARLFTRKLATAEAQALVIRIGSGTGQAAATCLGSDRQSYSLADIFAAQSVNAARRTVSSKTR